MAELNGPSKQYTISTLTNATPLRVKNGAAVEFEDRKVITLEPSGKMKVFFGDEGVTPNAATILASGFNHPKDVIRTYEATSQQIVWILASSTDIDVLVAERG